MNTLEKSEREAGFEDMVFFALLERSVDGNDAELSRRWVPPSHHSDTVLVFVGF